MGGNTAANSGWTRDPVSRLRWRTASGSVPGRGTAVRACAAPGTRLGHLPAGRCGVVDRVASGQVVRAAAGPVAGGATGAHHRRDPEFQRLHLRRRADSISSPGRVPALDAPESAGGRALARAGRPAERIYSVLRKPDPMPPA